MSIFTFVINNILGGYVPLGYNKLRTRLLNKKKHMWSDCWEKGVSIASQLLSCLRDLSLLGMI